MKNIAEERGLIISPYKTKAMAFMGKYQIKTRIGVNEKILNQVSSCYYLGCEIFSRADCDVENKLNRFQHICETIHKTLKYKTRKKTKWKFCNEWRYQ